MFLVSSRVFGTLIGDLVFERGYGILRGLVFVKGLEYLIKVTIFLNGLQFSKGLWFERPKIPTDILFMLI